MHGILKSVTIEEVSLCVPTEEIISSVQLHVSDTVMSCAAIR